MTIYWNPDQETDPDSIDIYHVADDGTESGPVTVDTSDVSGMPDSFGGIAPDAVRERAIDYVKNNASWSDSLTRGIVFDMLALNYERGTPP